MTHNIHWEPVMATGIAFVDDEHRHLMDDAAVLEAAFQARELEAVERAFHALVDGIGRHFENEELAMRQHRCDRRDYTAHKAEHDEFLAQLRFFHKRLGKCGVNLHADIMEFVSAWMIAHMLGQDRKMALQMQPQAA